MADGLDLHPHAQSQIPQIRDPDAVGVDQVESLATSERERILHCQPLGDNQMVAKHDEEAHTRKLFIFLTIIFSVFIGVGLLANVHNLAVFQHFTVNLLHKPKCVLSLTHLTYS